MPKETSASPLQRTIERLLRSAREALSDLRRTQHQLVGRAMQEQDKGREAEQRKKIDAL